MRILALVVVIVFLAAGFVARASARVVPTRIVMLDVESGACVEAPPSVRVRREPSGYRFDAVVPADAAGPVLVQASLSQRRLRLWVTRTAGASCMRRIVVRPRRIGEPVGEIVVETRDGIALRELVAIRP